MTINMVLVSGLLGKNLMPLQPSKLIGLLVCVALGVATPALALISQPVVEAEATAPRIATVLWDVPTEASENGDKVVASWELDLADNFSFSGADTYTYAADRLSTTLDRDQGLRSIKQYYVRVRAMYTDETSSNYGSTYFYTMIGKIKNLRVEQSLAGTAKLKWDKPAREGDALTYNVRLYRKSNDKLVFEDSVYGKNNLTVTGLTSGRRYYFKVRGRNDSKYGIGRWSDPKSFTAL
ncbi:MAG: fibronectin type III domain-containing protein [Candidatus Kerfeldbacteria bacterium]|nr:fibronectin type III domain-containing protein [Candidatus Kerfeldbacteria bacterium]